MTDARAMILARLRRGLGPVDDAARAAAVDARLAHPTPGPIPARAQLAPAARLDLFVRMAEQVDATVDRVPDGAGAVAAIARYLAAANLPSALVAAPDPRLDALPWDAHPTLTVRRGVAAAEDAVSVTPVFAGIAETGTLMLTSGETTPTTLNFLPDVHIAVVRAADVVGTYEDAWASLRRRPPEPGDGGFMPRTVNLVTGPSRTADIAMTLYLGAHGPRRLHIVVIDGDG
jgi:L-lactate dehydrogenase complex protein LldG